MKELYNAMISLSKDKTLRIVDELLQSNVDPEDILETGTAAMQFVGERFATGEFFLPELMVSGDILADVANKIKPFLEGEGGENGKKIGKIVFGTVAGDIHDIAKNIVVFMLEISGFEVIDLGVDVPAAKFVEAVQEHQAKIVGLSGFLTLAIEPMRNTILALKQAKLTDVKVMIGGAPMNEIVCEDIAADAWGENAFDAVSIAKQWAGATA